MRLDKNKYLLITYGLMLAGFLARLFVVLHAGSWWFDEGLSYSFAKLPILSSWQVLKYENNPPLYFWLLHEWGAILGFSEFSLRIAAVLVGVLMMVAIIRFATELFNRAVGLWAGAIYSVASLAIFLDTEARMYSLLGLLIVLTYLYFFRILCKNPTHFDYAAFIVFATLACYTNLTALWMPITQIIMIVVIKPKTISRFKATVLTILPAILYLPWLIPFSLEHFALSKYISAGSWWYFTHGLAGIVILTEPASFFNFWGTFSQFAGTVSFLLATIFLLWFIGHVWRRRSDTESKVMFLGLGLAVPLLISCLTLNLGPARYYYQSAIFFWIAMAYGIEYCFERVKSNFFAMGIMIGVALYALFNISSALAYPLHANWNVAARWIDAQRADMVLAMPKMWTAELYHPTTPFYFLPPPILALQDAGLDPLQTVTRYDYNWGDPGYIPTKSEEGILNIEVMDTVGSSSGVIFGNEGSAAEEIIVQDLIGLGFHPANSFSVYGYESERLTLFIR